MDFLTSMLSSMDCMFLRSLAVDVVRTGCGDLPGDRNRVRVARDREGWHWQKYVDCSILSASDLA